MTGLLTPTTPIPISAITADPLEAPRPSYVLTPEDRDDLKDALEQDKELRWFERDVSVARSSLLTAPGDTSEHDLKRRQLGFLEAKQRLEAAVASVREFMMPQFSRRAEARRRGADYVVFTREELRTLSVVQADRLQANRWDVRLGRELKDFAQNALRARGWHRGSRDRPHGGRGPFGAPPQTAWRVYDLLMSAVTK